MRKSKQRPLRPLLWLKALKLRGRKNHQQLNRRKSKRMVLKTVPSPLQKSLKLRQKVAISLPKRRSIQRSYLRRNASA